MGVSGARVSCTSTAGVTTTVAVAVEPLSAAVITDEPSPTVMTGKSAESRPAGTVTVGGTVATPVDALVSAISVASVAARSMVTRSVPGIPLGNVSGPLGGAGTGTRLTTTGGGGAI